MSASLEHEQATNSGIAQTPHPINPPPKLGGKVRITAEFARHFAAKALAARKRNADLRKAPPISTPPNLPLHTATEDKPDHYSKVRLKRVRAQLDMLDRMMAAETDPQKLDRLASAQAKLAEQERQLAGRPLPGSFRPTATKNKSNAAASPEPD